MWSIEPLKLELSTKEVAGRLSRLPAFMWLDSAGKLARETNRYSLFAAFSYKRLWADADGVYLNDGNKTITIEKRPFEALESELPNPLGSPPKLPFLGGALGFFSYDLARTYIDLKDKLKPLCSLPLMDWSFYDFALIYDHDKQQYFLFSRNEKPQTKEDLKEFRKALAKPYRNTAFNLKRPFEALMSKGNYQQGFKAIHNALLQGDAYQVNFTQPFSSEYLGDPFTGFCALRDNNQCAFSAFMDFGEYQLLSLSPERFLTLDSARRIEVRPIKGTVCRSNRQNIDKAFSEWLLKSEKNRQENVMIVDLMRNDLSRVCEPFSVRVNALCELLSLKSVHHLESVIEGKLKNRVRLSDVLSALFPCGSITGAPKLSAMNIIESCEMARREAYCGSIGYVSAEGQVDLNVAIRTLTAKDNLLHAYAGGGIVIDSNCEEEYQEGYHKLSKIFDLWK